MFSIVIPCFNNRELLKRTVAGLVQQLADVELEVILVDNNSQHEDLNDVYEKYFSELPIYLIKQPQLPHPMAVCRARNLGIQLAQYEWIVNIDSDCIPNPHFCARLRQFIDLQQDPNVMIAGLRIFVDIDDYTDEDIMNDNLQFDELKEVPSPSNYFLTKDRRWPEIKTIETSEHPWALIHSCNSIYRRETARAIGGYDEIFDGNWGYEDTDFAHRMITEGGARPVYLPGIECYHQDSMISENQQRFDKRSNPNWRIITERIPGLQEFKRRRYEKLNSEIRC